METGLSGDIAICLGNTFELNQNTYQVKVMRKCLSVTKLEKIFLKSYHPPH